MRTDTRWFWRKPGRLLLEPHAARDFALAHFRRHRRDLAGIGLAAERHLGRHAEPDRAGVRLGDAELDLERGEVDDGEQRRVLLHGRLLRHGERADDAVDGRLDLEFADAALEVGDEQLLAVALQAARLQFELEAFLLEARGLDRVVVRQPRLVELVLGALVVARADDLLVPGLLGACELALGGADRDARHVAGLLALQDLAAHVDVLAAQVDDEALERRALALELVAQARAVDGRDAGRPS